MSRTYFPRKFSRPLWDRLAVWLSFLAVLSALGAPVSALTLDMRSGKLGGVCSVDSGKGAAFSAASSLAQGDAQEDADHGHCTWCGSPGLGWLPAGLPADALAPVPPMAAAPAPGARAMQVAGLPFSRGPPSL